MKLFISYRRKSWPSVQLLEENLGEQIEGSIFVDYKSIDDTDFERSIIHHLRESDIVLVVVTEDTFAPNRIHNEKDWVRREIALALEMKKPIIPILIDNYPLPSSSSLPENIRDITKMQTIEFYPAYFDAAVLRLVAFITRVVPSTPESLEKRNDIPASKTDLNIPYRGNPTTLSLAHTIPTAPKRSMISPARKLIIALLVVLILLSMGGGIYAWRVNSSHAVTGVTHGAITATSTEAGTASMSSYDIYVSLHGIMFGFDAQHTRFNPYEGALDVDNVSQLQPKWTFPTGDKIDSSAPAVANSVIYVGSQDGKLYAIDAATGGKKWVASTGKAINSSPAVANGVVYVGSDDGNLNAFDISNGQLKWTFSTGGVVDSSPTVVNGVIYVGSQDQNLYAIDAATGKKKWAASTGKAINSSPAVADGVVYVGSDDGNLYAFDAATGDKKWTFSTGGVIDSSPAVANGMVYVGSQDKNFYAIDARTGRPKWTALTGAIHDSSPAVANGVVYVGSWQDHKLHAFDAATGEKKWATSTGDAIYSSPVVANGVVYVGSVDGKLYAFDATTGEKKWAASTENSIVCSPAVANGVVYVGSWDHKLYAFSRRK